MNRKERRASFKHGSSQADPGALYAEALALHRARRLDEAARAYKRWLIQKPDHAEAINNLATVLLDQGKRTDASAQFARALSLVPQAYDNFASVRATLVSVLPSLGTAMDRADAAWPARLPVDDLFTPDELVTITSDPLLLLTLRSVPARDLSLERILTSLRAAFLADATRARTHLAFCCALARQCFINEYVFATTPEEDEQVEKLRVEFETATSADDVREELIAIVACYFPLHTLSNAHKMLDFGVPPPAADVLAQQISEIDGDRREREQIPKLTAIDNDVSQRVREQYEANPYPRWVDVAGQVEPVPIDGYLRDQFPSGPFTPLNKTEGLDILAAGCGTGWQAIGLAQRFLGARVLAVDLSLSSLAYGKRRTPPALAGKISYGQADILKLGELGRSFDVVDSSGVLHHMADPLQGWRVLTALVRPGGLMHLAFYSELGRRDIVAAREFIAAQGYRATPADIRRARQELASRELRSFTRVNDFFSTSECRDLLFHVEEHRLGIPQLKTFMTENRLRFIGFEFDQTAMRQYRSQFAQAGWSLTDLDRWHDVETRFPNTFAGMYHFWAQKE